MGHGPAWDLRCFGSHGFFLRIQESSGASDAQTQATYEIRNGRTLPPRIIPELNAERHTAVACHSQKCPLSCLFTFEHVLQVCFLERSPHHQRGIQQSFFMCKLLAQQASPRL